MWHKVDFRVTDQICVKFTLIPNVHSGEREMLQLKARLLETEEQMTRILRAMETVQTKVADLPEDALNLKVI